MSALRQMAGCASYVIVLLVYSDQTNGQSPNPVHQTLGIGAYFAKGDYGATEPTEILYFPVSYALDAGQWGIRIQVPRLEVNGLGNVLVNVGGVTRAVAGTESSTSRGLGDVITSLVYRMPPMSSSAPAIDFRLDVKLPTADEDEGLGTGETDYSLQVDLSQNAGKNVLFATIGHNLRGKSELFPGLNDSTYMQLGIARPVADKLSAGIFYDYRQAASDFADESHELVPYFNWEISNRWNFTGLTTVGFSDASADIGVMVQLNLRW